MATNTNDVNPRDPNSTGPVTPDLTDEYVLRDGELYDSLFNEPEYFNSSDAVYAPTDPLSFESYVRSPGPESIGDGFSYEDHSSWQNVSLSSFTTTATSPWISGVSGESYSLGEIFASSLETTSPLAKASSLLCNDGFGGWSDQTIACEPLPDYDHARPITIPQPNHRYRAHHAPPTSSPRMDVPPVLSAELDAVSSSKISSLRNRSKSDPRGRSNSAVSSGSPRTKDFGWIQYQINKKTGKPVAYGPEKAGAMRTKGRTKGLNPEQRREAALMRLLGACSNCRRRKEKCDPGIPCRACLDHFKSDLVHNPCRNTLLADLSKIFLSERLGWHPTSRSLTSCLGNNSFSVLDNTRYTIPLNLGFGPHLYLSVHPLRVHDHSRLIHRHIIYPWPPPALPTSKLHNHAVLPAILTSNATQTLRQTLDSHISLLITTHFNAFPLFPSQLPILKTIYILYRHQPPNTRSAHILHQALKLLVLVHIGGDITLPPPTTDATGILSHLIQTTTSNDPNTTLPTPCFIRAQFGAVMPGLASSYMTSILSRVETLCLTRNCNEWPIVLATLILILMTVESIQYHAAKVPYHAALDLGPGFANLDLEGLGGKGVGIGLKGREARDLDEKGFETLRNFYRACFAGCHARLGEDWVGGNQDDGVSGNWGKGSPEDQFIDAVRETMRKAGRTGYLAGKVAPVGEEGGDMRWFFDRLVARFLVV